MTEKKQPSEKLAHRDLTPGPSERGLVLIFTGNGKGKTSAALGTVLRALGHGLSVYIVFFLKGDYPYGERSVLSKLPGVTISSFGDENFVDPDNVQPEQAAEAGRALAAAREAMLSGDYDMVVLDEVNVAAAFKMVSVDDVIQLIKVKPRHVELILTGRLADERLIQTADLVTEMVNIKHPYDKGLPARKGIEY